MTGARTIDPAAPMLVVLNRGSGRHDAQDTRQVIEAELRAAGRPHEVKIVAQPSKLLEVARRTVEQAQGCGGVVVVAGGDGTINTVVQATLGSGCPLGIVPQGTFNYTGRAHRLPLGAAEATRLLLTARAHPVQVGLINDRVFLVNASLGLYPQLLEDREAYKKQYGRSRLVALWAALRTMLKGHRQLHLHVEHEGRTHELLTPTLFVGNNRLQLEQIGIPEAPLVDSGLLAGIALRPVDTAALVALMLRGALGQLGDADKVVNFAFKRIVVTPALPRGKRRMKVATDGEVTHLQPPLEFRVAPEPLYLLKPDPEPELRPERDTEARTPAT